MDAEFGFLILGFVLIWVGVVVYETLGMMLARLDISDFFRS